MLLCPTGRSTGEEDGGRRGPGCGLLLGFCSSPRPVAAVEMFSSAVVGRLHSTCSCTSKFYDNVEMWFSAFSYSTRSSLYIISRLVGDVVAYIFQAFTTTWGELRAIDHMQRRPVYDMSRG